jgi:hypothetical protein
MSMTTLYTVRTSRHRPEDRTSRRDRTRTLEARTESRYRKQVRREKYGR